MSKYIETNNSLSVKDLRALNSIAVPSGTATKIEGMPLTGRYLYYNEDNDALGVSDELGNYVYGLSKSLADTYYKAASYIPSWSEITGRPTVFSGNYNDLTNKPDVTLEGILGLDNTSDFALNITGDTKIDSNTTGLILYSYPTGRSASMSRGKTGQGAFGTIRIEDGENGYDYLRYYPQGPNQASVLEFGTDVGGYVGNVARFEGKVQGSPAFETIQFTTLGQVNGLISTAVTGFAPSTGSTSYIQNQTSAAQTGGFRLSGNGIFNGWIGLSTPDPTHPLTFSSTAIGGIAHYNTAAQTSNYERFRTYWASNIFTIVTENSGTGVARAMTITSAANLSLGGAGATRMVVQGANVGGQLSLNGAINVTVNSSALGFTGSFTNSAGTANSIAILNTVTPTSTGGYRGIWISPVISGSATGARFLIDAGTNTTGGGTGTHTSVFSVTPTGAVTAALDVEVTNLNNGIILKAPGGVRWRVKVNDSGVLVTTSL